MASDLHRLATMLEICEDIKEHVGDVLAEWEELVRAGQVPLPPEHRIDSLPDVIIGLVQASLCSPSLVSAHRQQVSAAAEHGSHRRQHGIPEHLMLGEYHLLREALWRYLQRKYGNEPRTADAIMRIDTAITLATMASLLGYHRPEIQARGLWEQKLEQMVSMSPLLRGGRESPL